MDKTFLDKAYALETQADTDRLYAEWADSYDAEVGRNGYATPARCAAALWSTRPDPAVTVLDYGCGTGMSGQALHQAGYRDIVGMDPSPEMLRGARDKGCYSDLKELDLNDPAPIAQGSYSVIAAIGVIGVGAAPLSTFDMLLRALPRDGVLGFSFNDHALADPAFEGRVLEWTDSGHARLLFKEYGPHLPGQNLNSNVYVLEKA